MSTTSDSNSQSSSGHGHTLDWYPRWLQRRTNSLPPEISSSITSLAEVFYDVAKLTKEHRTIEEMATSLVRQNLVKAHTKHPAKDVARAISFIFVGWQSMLFDPMPSLKPCDYIEIADTLDGHCGVAFASRCIHYPSLGAPLPNLLIGFGLMLPKQNLCMSLDDDDIEAFEKFSFVTPRGMSAATLSSLANIKFKWIDVMGPHLEFDQATKTVFLYRFPSFCLANVNTDGTGDSKGVIHGYV